MKKLVLFVMALLVSAPLGADTIKLVDQDVVGVSIMDETPREVTFRDRNRKVQRVPSEKILAVYLDRAPKDLRDGLEAAHQGAYPKAIDSLRKVKDRKYQAYVGFYIGESYRKIGEFDKAATAFKKVVKISHRLTPRAQFQLGMIYIYKSNHSQAGRIFQQLRSKAYSKYWTYKGRYGEGLAKLYQKRYDPAYGDFNRIAGVLQGNKDPLFIELRQLCDQGRGLARVGSGSLKTAMKIFGEIIKSSSNPEALSGAYLGVGRARYRMAQRGQDAKNNYKRALFAYLRVVVLYPSQQLQYAEALHFGAKCFEQLNENKKAENLREEIKRRVPEWARYKG